MVIKYCPHCNTRFIADSRNKDYVHSCNIATSETLRNEDVPVVGNSDDSTGTHTVMQGDVKFAGVANKLFGTRAWTEGDDYDDVTSRGKRKSTHRTRAHEEYIEDTSKL